MATVLTEQEIAVLTALQFNRANPYPELMDGIRKSKFVLGHKTGSGYSITVRGLAALDRAKRQS